MRIFKLTALFTSILLSSFICSAQNILIADNNPGAVAVPGAVFTGATALTDAIAAAVDDDIIHVTRSTTNYGTVTVDKRLNIFGIGLFPDTDGGSRSKATQVDISDPAASGTRISGLVITSVLNLGGAAGLLEDLLIENGEILRIQHASGSTTLNNIIIRNNILGSNIGAVTDETIDLLAGLVSNVIIANNIIYGTRRTIPGGAISDATVTTDQSTLENNIFVHLTTGGTPFWYAFEELTNSVVKNNIFLGMAPQGFTTLSNNTFENNITFNTGSDVFSTGSGNTSSGNIEGVDPMLEKVSLSNSPGSLTTFNPALKVGSPGIGMGTLGTDMGVHGGPIPFNLEGTLIPTIQELDVPSMVVEGNTLDIHIKAKGN